MSPQQSRHQPTAQDHLPLTWADPLSRDSYYIDGTGQATYAILSRLWTPKRAVAVRRTPAPLPSPLPKPTPPSRTWIKELTHHCNRNLLRATCILEGDYNNRQLFHLALEYGDITHELAWFWRLPGLEAKAQLVRGHCLRQLGWWDQAYAAYVRAASVRDFAADESEGGLEAVTRLCAEMRDRMNGVSGVKIGAGGLGRGLLRCGTFGNVKGRREVGTWGAKRPGRMGKGQKTDVGDVKDANEDEDGWATTDVDDDEGRDDGKEEPEIDWIAIGSTKPPVLTYPPFTTEPPVPTKRPVCPKCGLWRPVLRSMRGRYI